MATAFITKGIIVSLTFGAQVVRPARLAEPLQLGDVGVVEIGDVGDGAGRPDHLLGDGAADLRHPLAADRSPGVLARLAGRDDRLERPWRGHATAARRRHGAAAAAAA